MQSALQHFDETADYDLLWHWRTVAHKIGQVFLGLRHTQRVRCYPDLCSLLICVIGSVPLAYPGRTLCPQCARRPVQHGRICWRRCCEEAA